MATEGGNFYIHNETPFDWIHDGQKSYQVSWGTYGKFPDKIPAYSSVKTHIEWDVFFVQSKDDRAHVRYKINVNGKEHALYFRGDKDTGKFNIWADFNRLGSLPIDKETYDIGWKHNGTVDFKLFYDYDKGKFVLERPNPLLHNGTMYIGYYDLDNFSAEHTYAIMKQSDGKIVNFQCYGGINGKNKKYPASFYSQEKNKLGTELKCNPTVARVLAAWDVNFDKNRTDYNRGLKGHFALGDCSGILYGVTGVCHQMCNTILCSTNCEYPIQAAVNWPQSFDISRFFYGFRGNAVHDYAIRELIKKTISLDETGPKMRELQTAFIKVDTEIIKDLSLQINCIEIEQRRKELVLQNIACLGPQLTDLSTTSPKVKNILEMDLITNKKKFGLDKMLICNQITKNQYADEVNNLVKQLNNKYKEVLEPSSLDYINDSNKVRIINPDMIPDYSCVRKQLKI